VISIRPVSLGGGFRYLMTRSRQVTATRNRRRDWRTTTPLRAPRGRLFGQGSRRSGRRSRSGSRLAGERGGPLQHARRVQRSGERRARRIEARAPAGGAPWPASTSRFRSPSRSLSCGLSVTTRREVSSRSATARRSSSSSPTRNARCSARGLDERDRFRRRDRCRRGVFTHFTSRADDCQLHEHVVVWNRARSVSTASGGRLTPGPSSRRRPRSQSSTRVSSRTF